MLLVKLIEPPCTERYARWCERSKIPHQEEFSPTRFLKEKYENKFKAYYTYEKGKNYTFLPIKIENVDLYKNQIKIW